MEKMKRNRNVTSQRIIEALEQVIAERGIEGIGINRIAEKAGVSKVLIYRYFGGLDGLLTYYVKMGRLFPVFSEATLAQLQPEYKEDLAKIWYKQVLYSFRFLRQSPAGREVLRAALIQGSPIARVISQAQDEEMTRLVEQLSFVKGTDVKAVSAVMLGALSYLTLLSQANQPILGISLSDDGGWERIEKAVKQIYISLNQSLLHSEAVQVRT